LCKPIHGQAAARLDAVQANHDAACPRFALILHAVAVVPPDGVSQCQRQARVQVSRGQRPHRARDRDGGSCVAGRQMRRGGSAVPLQSHHRRAALAQQVSGTLIAEREVARHPQIDRRPGGVRRVFDDQRPARRGRIGLVEKVLLDHGSYRGGPASGDPHAVARHRGERIVEQEQIDLARGAGTGDHRQGFVRFAAHPVANT